MTSSKNPRPTPIMTSPTEKLKCKTFQFFNRNYKTLRKGFEQLFTSIGWRVMASFISAKMAQLHLFRDLQGFKDLCLHQGSQT